MDWYLSVLKKYTQFSGRSRRKEYWMFSLISFLFIIALGLIEGLLGIDGFLRAIYSLAVLVPSLAVVVRRLHDTNRNGWWFLIGLVPIVGIFVLLYFLVQDSQAESNQYGENPKS
jgi:uncharacterized membrane protein YhaH (DUF805 family)